MHACNQVLHTLLIFSHPFWATFCMLPRGCDANSSFYGKGKSSVYDKVMKSPVAQRQLLQCGDSLDLKEDMVELFKFTRHVIYHEE